ncbi:hypothetical protein, partial [Paenibacillus sp. PL2-23]|uniref:hypothetical protein n=1 Tax=Paenibacillus sp. PL2-23 TaxID=2100729 RepID=UPI0030F7742F
AKEVLRRTTATRGVVIEAKGQLVGAIAIRGVVVGAKEVLRRTTATRGVVIEAKGQLVGAICAWMDVQIVMPDTSI